MKRVRSQGALGGASVWGLGLGLSGDLGLGPSTWGLGLGPLGGPRSGALGGKWVYIRMPSERGSEARDGHSRHQQAETSAVLDGQGLGCGTLYVTETRLSWFDGSGKGFSLEYPSISLHAISRDLGSWPQEHLYVMVNAKLSEHGRGGGDIPTFYTCEEGLSALTSEGEATLSRLEGMLAHSVAQQFHMAGVRTDDTSADFDDGMDVEGGATEAGQFEDADVDHW
ncbi:hypothetical protein CRUP_013541 [Coryphaenoides rupestris]|nr:hypothetical protein CRUP_013541 [Coryphaenoides rupestris]